TSSSCAVPVGRPYACSCAASSSAPGVCPGRGPLSGPSHRASRRPMTLRRFAAAIWRDLLRGVLSSIQDKPLAARGLTNLGQKSDNPVSTSNPSPKRERGVPSLTLRARTTHRGISVAIDTSPPLYAITRLRLTILH